jgi:hypothetical protein
MQGAIVYVAVRDRLDHNVMIGCRDRAQHLAEIHKAAPSAWLDLVQQCVTSDWSVVQTRKRAKAAVPADRGPQPAPEPPRENAPEDVPKERAGNSGEQRQDGFRDASRPVIHGNVDAREAEQGTVEDPKATRPRRPRRSAAHLPTVAKKLFASRNHLWRQLRSKLSSLPRAVLFLVASRVDSDDTSKLDDVVADAVVQEDLWKRLGAIRSGGGEFLTQLKGVKDPRSRETLARLQTEVSRLFAREDVLDQTDVEQLETTLDGLVARRAKGT